MDTYEVTIATPVVCVMDMLIECLEFWAIPITVFFCVGLLMAWLISTQKPRAIISVHNGNDATKTTTA